MSKKKQEEEEKLPETASELRAYLNKKNSQARAARRKLKKVEKDELVSAKRLSVKLLPVLFLRTARTQFWLLFRS